MLPHGRVDTGRRRAHRAGRDRAARRRRGLDRGGRGGGPADPCAGAAIAPDIASAVWGSVRRQGQHRCRRLADHAGLPGLLAGGRQYRPGGPGHPGRRRHLRGQDQSRSVRHRTQRHQNRIHGAAQRVRWRPDLGRLQFGIRVGGGPWPGSVRRRHRYRRLRPGAPCPQWRARVQAVPRIAEHRRAGPGLPLVGLCQPHRRHRRRSQYRLRRDRGPG